LKDSAKVMIAGAGIGGLTAAIALRRAGFEVAVFERAAELGEIGAGLLLAANAQKALGKLGLSKEVGSLGTPASAAEIRSWRGEVLASIPAGELEARVGAASAAVHRADLQALLLREVGEGPLRLGSEVAGFEQDEAGVTVLFVNGSEERADLLVGADGLRSKIGAELFGPEEPRYAGYAAWRAVVEPEQELLPWGSGFESWGRGQRFGCAHIGKGRVYWFATRNAPEGEKDGPPGSPTGARATLLEFFEGWHHPVHELIEATAEEAIRRDDLYDREPRWGHWGVGRVTLLGDAAHPMTPNLGQGACQAIEDAVVLARCLLDVDEADSMEVAHALRRYEGLRAERVATIVRRSRRIGQVGQLENPLLCLLRDRSLKLLPAKVNLGQMEGIVGHEA
jgi:2-polyprenyl-6-methoxyphenol hydroxylase-like FAD-dependent oxidoreductase